jgi:hypothetical protein
MKHPWRTVGLLIMTVALLPLLAGCRDEVRGPVTLQGVIDGPGPVGAAFFVLPIEGVLSVEAVDGDHLFTRFIPDDGVIRVVLVAGDRAAGPLRFRVQVADARVPRPQGSLVQLADIENRPIPNHMGYRIQIRP